MFGQVRMPNGTCVMLLTASRAMSKRGWPPPTHVWYPLSNAAVVTVGWRDDADVGVGLGPSRDVVVIEGTHRRGMRTNSRRIWAIPLPPRRASIHAR